MSRFVTEVLTGIGLGRWPEFSRDSLFIVALIVAVAVWGILWLTVMPTFTLKGDSIVFIVFISVIWSPLLEEILFRGVLQGYLLEKSWGGSKIFGLTKANWLTSLIFVLAHLWGQPVIWAISVLAPSLVYGFFRDRYNHTFPSILLHAYYNGGFILANVLAQ